MTTMSENREQSCAERIDAHRESRENDLRTLFDIAGSDEEAEYDGETLDAEAAQDRLYEYPLGVSTFVTLRIDLSTGGPADYLTAKLSREGGNYWAVESVSYHFADWFDHAEENVPEDSPLWRLAEFYAESLDPSASLG